jgi:hypothetical protein
MRDATIVDIPTIITLLAHHYGEDKMEGMEFYLSNRIRNTFDNTYMLNEDNNLLFIFERIGNFKCQFHVYSLPEIRGRGMKKEFIDALESLSNRYSAFLTFVPNKDKAAHVATRAVGGKLLAVVPNSGGKGINEALYIIGGK